MLNLGKKYKGLLLILLISTSFLPLHSQPAQSDFESYIPSFSAKKLIIKKPGGLFTNDYETTWDMHELSLQLLADRINVESRIVTVSKNENNETIYRNTVRVGNDSDLELAVISKSYFDQESRGKLGKLWNLKYDFFVQVRKHVLNQSIELLVQSRVFERKEGSRRWRKADYNDEGYLPEGIFSKYERIDKLLYVYWTNYKFDEE